MNEPREITKWITQHQWDFFITITFDKRYSDTHILNIMEDIENHYLIQQICWYREFTTTGLPHIHMVANQNLGINGEHLAPFPKQIITLPLLQSSKIGDLVLDPFCGSCNVGRVCDVL